jgi:uncharacterized tellurite resistance protein B-like protein
MEDRIEAVCDLLMGAAYADKELHEKEKQVVTDYLVSLLPEGELSKELTQRIDDFSPDDFKLASVLAKFSGDSDEDRKKLLEIVAAVHSADDEHDFDEDEFINAVAAGLSLSDADKKTHVLDYEVESLKEHLAKLRPSPPPIPRA